MIVYTIIQVVITLAAAGVIGYSIFLTVQVSGDRLLTMDSTLGYRYAVAYRQWQLYAGIAIAVLLLLWVLYILAWHRYRMKHREERLAKKTAKKAAKRQEKQKKKTVGIPFNRQQLADYLAVDRSALSAELSRMKKDGLIEFEKNLFSLL